MKYKYFIVVLFLAIGLSACKFGDKVKQEVKDQIAEDQKEDNSNKPEEENESQSKAIAELTIDGENFNATLNEHYVTIAKERTGEISYRFSYNIDNDAYKLNTFQLSFRVKEKIEIPYEVELDFKKTATDRKLKTYLTVFYVDENGKRRQTSNDVGKIVITEMSEDKISMEVDTKLLLLDTMNTKGEAETVLLKGNVESSNPIITMMNGATKEEIF